jgi:hypothetical protein
MCDSADSRLLLLGSTSALGSRALEALASLQTNLGTPMRAYMHISVVDLLENMNLESDFAFIKDIFSKPDYFDDKKDGRQYGEKTRFSLFFGAFECKPDHD